MLPDTQWDEKESVPAEEFRYMTRGMVRLSRDSVLNFSLMTNNLDSQAYKNFMAYITHFVTMKQ